jgi:hypothetical protein
MKERQILLVFFILLFPFWTKAQNKKETFIKRNAIIVSNYISIPFIGYERVLLNYGQNYLSFIVGIGGYQRDLYPNIIKRKAFVPAANLAVNYSFSLKKGTNHYLELGTFLHIRNEYYPSGEYKYHSTGFITIQNPDGSVTLIPKSEGQIVVDKDSIVLLQEKGTAIGLRLAYCWQSNKNGFTFKIGLTPMVYFNFPLGYKSDFPALYTGDNVPLHLLEYHGRSKSYKQIDFSEPNPAKYAKHKWFIFPYPELSVGWRF